jgi:methanogenic corrinoid protein MtbC1
MSFRPDLISPREAAHAIGVSESSLKRWCDQGLFHTVRTVGGHRKLPIADVLRFVHEHRHPLASPEILGLPPASLQLPAHMSGSIPILVEALVAGKEPLARQIVLDLYLASHSLSAICDNVLSPAFSEIGDRWACQSIDIYQERRSCEICQRILFDMRELQRLPESGWQAIGGTIEGDLYALPSTMVELVLRECGFHASSLGNSIPIPSLIRAVEETRPELFWLSVSHVREGLDLVREFSALSLACARSGTALVVGGRALGEKLRQRMVYSAFCDTMQQLESFAQTLFAARGGGDKPQVKGRRRVSGKS